MRGTHVQQGFCRIWRRLRLHAGLFLLATLPVFSVAANTSEAPLRVVSLNYCLDDQLQPYAEQGIIALYPSREHGARFEPILEFAPDLVLATPFTAHYRLRAFEQANLNVVVLDEPSSVDQAADVARTLHELVSGDEKDLVSETVFSSIGTAKAQDLETKPSVLFYLANQWSFGAETFWHDLTEQLGWRNLAAQHGSGLVSVSLEHLLLWQPDIVVMEVAEQSSPDLAHINLRHPSFRRYIAQEQVQLVQLPRAMSGCMAQRLPEVISRLSEASL